MRVTFAYDREKDIWCLLNKGRSSHNSPNPTRQYRLLVERYGENPTPEEVGAFVDGHIAEKGIDVARKAEDFQRDWETVSADFQKRAESAFGVSLPADVAAYLTVNSRCPYSIEENFFYVSLGSATARATVMHELWHFYTWHGLGADQVQKLGAQRYNDLKESLTVLLNVECKDLLPEGVVDAGYPQHQEIRQRILSYWERGGNVANLWGHIAADLR